MKTLSKRTFHVEQSIESYVNCLCSSCSCGIPRPGEANQAAHLQSSSNRVMNAILFERTPNIGCAIR